jgi:hypothetical protein
MSRSSSAASWMHLVCSQNWFVKLIGRHQPAEEIEGHRIRFATGTGKSDHSPGAAGR